MREIEGYPLEGPIKVVNDGIFVQRSTMRGRPWLRFCKKIDAEGFHVTAYKTRKAAVIGPWTPLVGR